MRNRIVGNRKTLIFGAGFSGKAYGAILAAKGETIFGTTRSAEKSGRLAQLGISPLVFDGQTLSTELALHLNDITDLIISIAPDETGGGDPVLNASKNQLLNMPNLEWVAYLSTVGVYGNHDGAWVDENTTCLPVSARSKERLEAEQNWQSFANQKNVPLATLRLSGIYGPGRNGLKNMVDGTARRLVKPGQVFNRIHNADIAGALDLLSAQRADGIYNVTDDLPAPPQDVVEYAAFVTNLDCPEAIDFETATLSPMARSFYGENKRVSNTKLKQAGYIFKYPNYRAAFDQMWAQNNWK
ncbi:MAG: SDR family oxidoreductase [Ahrensia sp.]|nr:SDR family oxidoreductase [Ahrensia sp.]